MARGLLVALVAFIGAALMLIVPDGMVNSPGAEDLLQLFFLAAGPALSALLFHRLLLKGQPVLRVLSMVLTTLVGICLAGVIVVILMAFDGGVSLDDVILLIFYLPPMVFWDLISKTPAIILIWIACAGITLWLGERHRPAAEPG